MRVCRTPNNEKTRSQTDKKIIATRFNLFSSPRLRLPFATCFSRCRLKLRKRERKSKNNNRTGELRLNDKKISLLKFFMQFCEFSFRLDLLPWESRPRHFDEAPESRSLMSYFSMPIQSPRKSGNQDPGQSRGLRCIVFPIKSDDKLHEKLNWPLRAFCVRYLFLSWHLALVFGAGMEELKAN